MVQFIVGDKGKGKTRYLLEQANTAVKEIPGNIVYLDKSSSKMYELNNKIRLIDVSSFPLRDSSEFIGFLCGIISQDHDLQKVFLDNYMNIAKLGDEFSEELEKSVAEIEEIGKQFDVEFVLSIALDKQSLSADMQEKVTVAL